MATNADYRPELDVAHMPGRIRNLRVSRGYPVPWFVQWLGHEPEFRLMDPAKLVAAVHERRCWVCGETLGRYLSFLIGPMCGVNRVSSEPPSHRECAVWSAKNCPFLSRPHATRREDTLTQAAEKGVAGVMIKRNPGVAMVWTTKKYRVFPDDKGKPLFDIGEPETVEWYSEGRSATRAEVEASIESGFPLLLETGSLEDEPELRLARERLNPWLPGGVSQQELHELHPH